MNIVCRNGHPVPAGSKFCNQCGETVSVSEAQSGAASPLENSVPAESWGEPLQPGTCLRERYIIQQQLGQGGFGRTYLAEDTGRFREKFVIKEFLPSLKNTSALKKSEELFQREAATLHQLEHPQIPRFWAIFREEKRVFLVVDYVIGSTYKDLLEQRLHQGHCFTEAEILNLFQRLLPVLSYLHRRGVIHRDISPDNIICRSQDQLPVLIDMGGVKQVAMEVGSQLETDLDPSPVSFTRLGKAGYAPDEQINLGLVAPHSDLYALAVTALVMMTGKKPQQLLDQNTLQWKWEEDLKLSPLLTRTINQMMALKPMNRFQSADEILYALAPLFATTFSKHSSDQTAISAAALSESSEQRLSAEPFHFTHKGQNPALKNWRISSGWIKWLVPALVLIAGPALVLIAGGLTYFFWKNPLPFPLQQTAVVELPRDPDLQLRNSMQEVENIPSGLFNYGGAPAFAALTSHGMNDAIIAAHPDYRLRYTEPPSGSPGSGTGIDMLINGELSIAQSARPLEDADYDKAKTRGLSLKQVPVAIDGVVYYTHPGLNIPGLSVDQLQGIYRGEVTNWQQVGGPNLKITPIGLDPKITSALKLLLGDGDDIGSNVEIVRDLTAALRQVAATPGGISYASAPLVINQKSIRPIAMAKAKSTQYIQPFTADQQVNGTAFKDSTYPMTRRLFIVIRRDGSIDEKAGTAYINLLLSREGQDIIEKAGYVAIR
jgi:serine/threonine protein kinase/ABC-type phosphate transport system substrate-binding protein